MSHIRKGLAAVALAAGAGMLAASPAVAAPNWSQISPDSNWNCGNTTTHPAGGVLFQTCIVSRPGGNTQGVLVVRNNSGRSIKVQGEVTVTAEWSNGYTAHNGDCVQSTLSSGYGAGCLASTADLSGSAVRAVSRLAVDGHWAYTVAAPVVYPS